MNRAKYKAEAAGAIGLNINDLERAIGVSDLVATLQASEAQQQAEMRKSLIEAVEFQGKCEDDAMEFLAIYWSGYDKAKKSRTLNLTAMREWVEKNCPLSSWFLIHLIEAAGEKALEVGYSQHTSAMAKMKNAAPRAWVLEQWTARPDAGQGKAAFARQYAMLVKKQFNLAVTPETIARDWLPKG